MHYVAVAIAAADVVAGPQPGVQRSASNDQRQKHTLGTWVRVSLGQNVKSMVPWYLGGSVSLNFAWRRISVLSKGRTLFSRALTGP